MEKIIERDGVKYELLELSIAQRNASHSCDFCDLLSAEVGCGVNSCDCFCYYKRKSEVLTMTEQEIAKFWKDNRAEKRIFAMTPIEAQKWLLKNRAIADDLNERGSWRTPLSIETFQTGVYAIPADYQSEPPEKQGRWVEYDVNEKGMFVEDKSPFYWDRYAALTDYDFIFGGWLWKHKERAFYSVDLHGLDSNCFITCDASEWQYPLIPKKIRFWVVD